MNINELTIGEAREIAAIFGAANAKPDGLKGMIGEKAIVRTYSAGVWFGTVAEKSGNEVIVKNARRMWSWKAAKSISLSACAVHGIDRGNSKIVEPVEAVWLEAIEIIPCTSTAVEAIEIIPCTSTAVESIEGAPHVKAS